MKPFPKNSLTLLLFAAFYLIGCNETQQASSHNAATASAPNAPNPVANVPAAANGTISFLEARVKQNPDDFIAYNKLAAEYLQQMRLTGDATYLKLASHAAESSLEVLPPQQNKGGLAALALVKYSMHEFTAARDLAKQLVDLEANKGYAYQMLGDALLELGQYEEAENAFGQMEQSGGIQLITQAAMKQRKARLAALKGDLKSAAKHYSEALKLAQSTPAPAPETVAYCQWQLGETAFSGGDYKTAEKYFRGSLETFPDYPAALAAMGRVLAAQSDLPNAIDFSERAARRFPDLNFVAALGDLYKVAGREEDAQKQYQLAEQIGRLSEINGTLYNRSLAMFYADHDLKPEEAYQSAAKEYTVRRDIYGADALAWTAIKAGKTAEAQTAIKEALRLGTKDARLFYHAGIIAKTSGENAEARKYLQSALALNPKFALLQAEVCKKTLETL